MRTRMVVTAIAVAVASTGALGASARPVAAGGDALEFDEGPYDGVLAYDAGVVFEAGTTADDALNGTFAIDVSGGAASGTFELGGTGVGVSDAAEGRLDFSLNGNVTGPASAPVLESASGTATGEVTVQGVTVPVNVTFGPEESLPVTLVIESATCEQVSGTWGWEGIPYITAAGGSGAIEGHWVAVRGGAAAPAPEREGRAAGVAAVMAEAEDVYAAAKAGRLDTAALVAVVEKATALAATLSQDGECGEQGAQGECSLVISDLVADLLEVVLDDPSPFTVDQLYDVTLAGIQSCVFSGGVPKERGDEIRAGLHDVFDQRLDGATGPETAQIHDIAAAMGWHDIAGSAEGTDAEKLALDTKKANAGAHPVLRWEEVDGAAEYVAVVQSPKGVPFWGWRGAAPEVRFGGGELDAPDDGPAAATLTKKKEWFVLAYDADGGLVGVSATRPIAP